MVQQLSFWQISIWTTCIGSSISSPLPITHVFSVPHPDKAILSPLLFCILGKTIKPISSAKDVGVIFDAHLTYDFHITKLMSSCMSKLCQINRVKDSFNSDTLTLVIVTLIISRLLYCSCVWSNTSSSNLKKIQAVQNFACRIITNIRKFNHVTPSLRQLNLLPIEQLMLYRDTVMIYKCIKNLASSYLSNKFRKRSKLHEHPMRDQELLNIPLFRTATGQRTFHYRAVKIWNDLEDELKHIPTFGNFKRKLKSHLLDKFHLIS